MGKKGLDVELSGLSDAEQGLLFAVAPRGAAWQGGDLGTPASILFLFDLNPEDVGFHVGAPFDWGVAKTVHNTKKINDLNTTISIAAIWQPEKRERQRASPRDRRSVFCIAQRKEAIDKPLLPEPSQTALGDTFVAADWPH